MRTVQPFKALSTAATALTLLAIASLPCKLSAQALSYYQVISLIKTFEGQKVYTNTVTGPMLDSIIQGMVANDGPPPNSNPSDGIGDSEGLKKRLVGGVSSRKIGRQAAAALSVDEGNLLELLYVTRQSVVPSFITDADLRGRVGGIRGTGAGIKRSETIFWASKNITTNLIECLEGFPPATATVLVDCISATWYQQAAGVYENTATSWASQSLWQICHDAREVELAKRSVVIKLLVNQGYIALPTVTYAQFIWSQGYYGYAKWPNIAIYLDSVTWSAADVPALTRLLANPYYAAAAQAQLTAMGY